MLKDLFRKKEIKTMNNKMGKKYKSNLKYKLSKEEEQRQNHGYRVCFGGCQMGRQCRGMAER